MIQFTRRSTLGLLGGAALASQTPAAFAQGISDRKFIFIILRGAMDGLSALIPEDENYASLRRGIAIPENQRLDLGNGFALHGAFATLKADYDQGHAAFFHAAATSYRERSHFDGQDVLESLGVDGGRSGWLNRALHAAGARGLAVSHSVPLALRGPAPVSNWSPPVFEEADEDLLDRLSDLYASTPEFAEPLARARENMSLVGNMGEGRKGKISRNHMLALQAVGKLMAAEDGPGVGMVELGGWDTHTGQVRRLNRGFRDLDAGLAALKAALGAHWAKTCIVISSEFGRTVAVNGTNGTDHGTGGLVTLLGGAVRGGRVYGDWPGLKRSELYEARDLAPANDISAILKGVLRDHLGVDRAALDASVLPGSGRAYDGLILT